MPVVHRHNNGHSPVRLAHRHVGSRNRRRNLVVRVDRHSRRHRARAPVRADNLDRKRLGPVVVQHVVENRNSNRVLRRIRSDHRRAAHVRIVLARRRFNVGKRNRKIASNIVVRIGHRHNNVHAAVRLANCHVHNTDRRRTSLVVAVDRNRNRVRARAPVAARHRHVKRLDAVVPHVVVQNRNRNRRRRAVRSNRRGTSHARVVLTVRRTQRTAGRHRPHEIARKVVVGKVHRQHNVHIAASDRLGHSRVAGQRNHRRRLQIRINRHNSRVRARAAAASDNLDSQRLVAIVKHDVVQNRNRNRVRRPVRHNRLRTAHVRVVVARRRLHVGQRHGKVAHDVVVGHAHRHNHVDGPSALGHSRVSGKRHGRQHLVVGQCHTPGFRPGNRQTDAACVGDDNVERLVAIVENGVVGQCDDQIDGRLASDDGQRLRKVGKVVQRRRAQHGRHIKVAIDASRSRHGNGRRQRAGRFRDNGRARVDGQAKLCLANNGGHHGLRRGHVAPGRAVGRHVDGVEGQCAAAGQRGEGDLDNIGVHGHTGIIVPMGELGRGCGGRNVLRKAVFLRVPFHDAAIGDAARRARQLDGD